MAILRSLLWWFPALLIAILSIALRFSPVPLLPGIMGNSGSRAAAVPDVLALDPPESSAGGDDGGAPDVSSLAADRVDARLASLGVDPSTSDSEDERRACLARVSHPDFWRTHHTRHPNAKRVKAWLFVHAKYREQLDDVVSAAGETAAGGAAAARKLPALKLAAGKFRKKIARHSKFEDEQLFPFFREEVCAMRGKGEEHVGDEEDLAESLAELMDQHSGEEKDQSDAVSDALDKASVLWNVENVDEERLAEALQKVVEVLRSYQDNMLSHLELEERTLVGRWLGLSEELYSVFRAKYLKFPYSFMY